MLDVRVFAVVRDTQDRILCVLRAHSPHDWTLPGGKVERGESLATALVREVREESGFEVEPGRLIGVYSTPEQNDLALLFEAVIRGRESWKPDREIARAEFHPAVHLPEPFSEHARIRIEDALAAGECVLRVLEKKRVESH